MSVAASFAAALGPVVCIFCIFCTSMAIPSSSLWLTPVTFSVVSLMTLVLRLSDVVRLPLVRLRVLRSSLFRRSCCARFLRRMRAAWRSTSMDWIDSSLKWPSST